jgi:SAM-dependent methyltransferase
MHEMNQFLSRLIALQEKPAPFTPGEPLFWDDPHISAQMLEAHLDPDIEAASRRQETIERSVEWLIRALGLQPGDSLLDLGCGPGLYASRFARAGFKITGVDSSRRSIEYASKYAREHHLEVIYRYENYLELQDKNAYDAAFLIYGDFCPLSPEARCRLLDNIRRALKPNGKFVLDVTTRENRRKHGNRNRWYALESGFWKPGPHLVLEEGFEYPEQSIWLDQFTIIEAGGKMTVYRNWFQDYTPETVTQELSEGGFCVESLWGDLTGKPYAAVSEWLGVITRKP